MEIERKFLVKSLPKDLSKHESKCLVQSYISFDPELRIRSVQENKKSFKYFLTFKSDGDMVRQEQEFKLTEKQFHNLWNKIEAKVIEKTRYFIPLENKLTAELDIYQNVLEGLCTVEVEFSNIQEANDFDAPSWFGKEVTKDSKFKNRSLAVWGNPLKTKE